MKKRSLAALFLAMSMTLAACGGSQPAPETKAAETKAEETKAEEAKEEAKAGEAMMFRGSMPEASTDNKALAIQEVVKNIEERTDGRVTFEVYYSGELGNFTDTIEGIALV